MKFRDILGEAMLSDEYRKVSHKVKLMYKTLRKGRIEIGKLIPDMVPFFTGFEMVDNKDALITYELPNTYHLESGHEIYNLIITGITINCEKYPGLADDIDIREDLLRRLAHRLNNALIGSFNEGQQIKFQIRKKGNLPSYGFVNLIGESVVDPEDSNLVNKIKLAFKVLKNGNAIFDHPFYNTKTKTLQHRTVDFKYELPNNIRIHKNHGDTTNPFTIWVPEFKIYSETYSTLGNSSEVREKVLRIISDKLNKIIGMSLGDQERINIVFEKPHHNKILSTPVNINEESTEDQNTMKKAPTIYKALKKGTIELDIHAWNYNTVRPEKEEQIKFEYELPNTYKIIYEEYNNRFPVLIHIPELKIKCPQEPELETAPFIKGRIMEKIRVKFQNFGLSIFIRTSQLHKKNNGTWVAID